MKNGDFELWSSSNNPINWERFPAGNTTGVFRVDTVTNVLTGNFSAGIKNATMQQIVSVNPGCFYSFSFSARTNDRTSSLTATVTFLDKNGDEFNQPTEIVIRQGGLPSTNNVFNYYYRITQAPKDAVSARIRFRAVTSGNPVEYVFVDDVSFHGI